MHAHAGEKYTLTRVRVRVRIRYTVQRTQSHQTFIKWFFYTMALWLRVSHRVREGERAMKMSPWINSCMSLSSGELYIQIYGYVLWQVVAFATPFSASNLCTQALRCSRCASYLVSPHRHKPTTPLCQCFCAICTTRNSYSSRRICQRRQCTQVYLD